MSSPIDSPRVVWRFLDGKAGHEAQAHGLVQALAGTGVVEAHDFVAGSTTASILDLLLARFPAGTGLPAPDLIIGAGHATHLPMLAARRVHGGRVVVLMRPSLPLAWFDLVVAPEHDGLAGRGNVLVTRGALTDIRPSDGHDSAHGLILIGGPSAHFHWSDEDVAAQVVSLVEGTPEACWTLTTSRRTPESFLPRLAQVSRDGAFAGGTLWEGRFRPDNFHRREDAPPTKPAASSGETAMWEGRPRPDAFVAPGEGLPQLEVVPVECTDRSWLLDQLARAGQVWVSADSVSMVCEALTSGAAVGLIELPAKHDSRVARGLAGFVAEGLITTHGAWRQGARFTPPTTPFDEAARIAAEIRKRWQTAA